jgi:hypothetical protein
MSVQLYTIFNSITCSNVIIKEKKSMRLLGNADIFVSDAIMCFNVFRTWSSTSRRKDLQWCLWSSGLVCNFKDRKGEKGTNHFIK